MTVKKKVKWAGTVIIRGLQYVHVTSFRPLPFASEAQVVYGQLT